MVSWRLALIMPKPEQLGLITEIALLLQAVNDIITARATSVFFIFLSHFKMFDLGLSYCFFLLQLLVLLRQAVDFLSRFADFIGAIIAPTRPTTAKPKIR